MKLNKYILGALACVLALFMYSVHARAVCGSIDYVSGHITGSPVFPYDLDFAASTVMYRWEYGTISQSKIIATTGSTNEVNLTGGAPLMINYGIPPNSITPGTVKLTDYMNISNNIIDDGMGTIGGGGHVDYNNGALSGIAVFPQIITYNGYIDAEFKATGSHTDFASSPQVVNHNRVLNPLGFQFTLHGNFFHLYDIGGGDIYFYQKLAPSNAIQDDGAGHIGCDDYTPTWQAAPAAIGITTGSVYNTTNGTALDPLAPLQVLTCSSGGDSCAGFNAVVTGTGTPPRNCNVAFTAGAPETCALRISVTDAGTPAFTVGATIAITVNAAPAPSGKSIARFWSSWLEWGGFWY